MFATVKNRVVLGAFLTNELVCHGGLCAGLVDGGLDELRGNAADLTVTLGDGTLTGGSDGTLHGAACNVLGNAASHEVPRLSSAQTHKASLGSRLRWCWRRCDRGYGFFWLRSGSFNDGW